LTWANRASLQAASGKSNGGIWGDEPLGSGNSKSKNTMAGMISNASNNSGNQSSNSRLLSHQQLLKNSKDKETSEESFMKLFQVQQQNLPSNKKHQQKCAQPDEFTKWCYDSVESIGSSVDIPTFVGFLKEVESPYDVADYVRSYLGDGRDAREFGREFLERRSRWKNSRKDGGESSGFEDNLCRPAAAVNPNQNEFQEVKVQ